MKLNYFFEQVVTNSTQRIAYSLPDVLGEVQAKELIDAIEADPTLNAMVFGDEGSLPGSTKASAADIWSRLGSTDVGKDVLAKNPKFKQFRISSVSTRGSAFKPNAHGTDREIEFYDKWANTTGHQLQNMPSFKEFMLNPEKWRPQEISGTGPKQVLPK